MSHPLNRLLSSASARMLTVVAVVLIGAYIRFVEVGRESLWIDEAASIWIAQKPFHEFFPSLLTVDTHPPLYHLMLKVWLIAGDSVAWIRALSVLLSAATIVFAFKLGVLLYQRFEIGVSAAVLVALSPLMVYQAQDARMYPLLGLLVVSSTYFLLSGLFTNSRVHWLLYALATAAALYTHTLAIFIVMAHVMVITTHFLLGKDVRPAFAAVLAAVAVWLPWVPITFTHMERGVINWIPAPTLDDLRATLVNVVARFVPLDRTPVEPEVAAGVVAGLVIALAGAGVLYFRARPLLLVSALVPALGPVILMLAATLVRPVFLERTVIGVAALLLVFVAGGIAAVTVRLGRRYGVPALLALVTLEAAGVWNYHHVQSKERWDEAAALVAARVEPADAILFQSNSSELPFRYYYGTSGGPVVQFVGVPCSLDECTRYEGVPTPQDRAALAAQLRQADRLWVVKRWWGNWDFGLGDAVGTRLAQCFILDQEHDVGGVVVTLFRRTTDCSRDAVASSSPR